MSEPAVVFFGTDQSGGVRRLLPLIAGVASHGCSAHVFTDRRFMWEVELAGGTFRDLFSGRALEGAQDESRPYACRHVTFAGLFADQVIAEVRRLRPSLVVYDTFAVIGRVVATALGLPYVNVCHGHGDAAAAAESHVAEHGLTVGPRCLRAVELLRDRYGLADAAPLAYAHGVSPHLNVYCEPEPFLTDSVRAAYEPIACYGSLPSGAAATGRSLSAGDLFFGPRAGLRVYVSFGTIQWRYTEAEALAALKVLSTFLARRPGIDVLVSLGRGGGRSGTTASLAAPNVRVEPYVDQWQVLGEADLFVTHHGLMSTHEAIFQGVPMLGYPFIMDQPSLARICTSFGVSIPLASSPCDALTEEGLEQAFAELARTRNAVEERLALAREWELEAIAGRPAIDARIAALAGQRSA